MTKRSELVLPPGTFAYSLDRSNAKMSVLVGPLQNKLEEQEGAVIWDRSKGRTVGCPVDRAVQPIVIVPADSYAVVTNPHIVDGQLHQPPAKRKTQVDEIELQYGRVQHVSGPTAIIPWPGQDVQVRKRFQLGRDQYVRVEVTEWLDSDTLTSLLSLADVEDVESTPVQLGSQFVITGKKTSIFTPPTGVTVLGNTVKTADRLDAFEWARYVSDDGTARYVHGPALVYPRVNEKFDKRGKAIDLSRVGLHARRLVQTEHGPAGEEVFLTRYGQEATGEPHYYWPDGTLEEIATIEPIDVPDGGGLYLREHGDSAVKVHTPTAPLLIDPLRFELVDREESCFAPAVVVQDNQATEIVSPKGSRVVVGPQLVLLEYNEQEGETLVLRNSYENDTAVAETSDGIPVYATVRLTRAMAGTPADWFRASSARHRVHETVEQLFVSSVKKLTAAQVEADNRVLQDVFAADSAFSSLAPDVTVSDVFVKVRFADPETEKAIEKNRKTAAMHRLEEQGRALTRQECEAKQKHEAALDGLVQETAERIRCKKMAEKQAELDAEKVELEAKKSVQDLLDELATYELDREARRNQQLIDHRKREVDLERQAVETKTSASVEVLNAIQPHLIEAIRTAGAQTSFSKVVQHLGPASILQGIGLQEALTKMIGNDAASSLLLTGSPAADKPNGRSKRPNVEP